MTRPGIEPRSPGPLANTLTAEPTISTQNFVSERSRIHAGSKQTIKYWAIPRQNLLGSSGDWEVFANLPGWHNNYPKTISSKGLWRDIVLLSRANLKIIVVELSISYESRMDQSHEYKTSKYEDVKKKLEKEGYSMIVKAAEIGARGFVAGALYEFQIRIKGRNKAKCIKRLLELTENSSMWIWNERNILWNNSKWILLNWHLIVNA